MHSENSLVSMKYANGTGADDHLQTLESVGRNYSFGYGPALGVSKRLSSAMENATGSPLRAHQIEPKNCPDVAVLLRQ